MKVTQEQKNRLTQLILDWPNWNTHTEEQAFIESLNLEVEQEHDNTTRLHPDIPLTAYTQEMLFDLCEVVEKYGMTIGANKDVITIGQLELLHISPNQKTGLVSAVIIHPNSTITGFKDGRKRGFVVSIDNGLQDA